MSTVHYEIEASVAEFLRHAREFKTPDDAAPSSVIANRHIDVAASLLRMTLIEANNGTPLEEILGGVADIVVEFLHNVVEPHNRPDKIVLVNSFFVQMAEGLQQALNGGGYTSSGSEIYTVQGGRA